MEALKDLRLDAAVIALPYDAPSMGTTGLIDDEFLCASVPDHPLAQVDHLSPEMLSEEPLLLLCLLSKSDAADE